MSNLIHYTACPICRAGETRIVLNAKDHTVSGKLFPIAECLQCSLRFTQDVPDSNSIGRYYKAEDYISHTNTSKGLINRLYQLVRKRTLASKRRLIQRSTKLQKGALLDYGSGAGSFVDEMSKAGWNVLGLEPDVEARRKAKELYGVELGETGSFFQIEANRFDAISLWHVLEHVHELNECVAQLKRVLKDDGRIFIAVPNHTSFEANAYKEHWAAYDVPRHLYHFSPASMKKLMSNHGLEIEKQRPMWYDSFYISLLSSRYKNGTSNWFGAGLNGLISNLSALFDVERCSSVIYVVRKKS